MAGLAYLGVESSGSKTRLEGTGECNSVAVLVLPQPKVPFRQMITWPCYECVRSHDRGQRSVARVTALTTILARSRLGVL